MDRTDHLVSLDSNILCQDQKLMVIALLCLDSELCL